MSRQGNIVNRLQDRQDARDIAAAVAYILDTANSIMGTLATFDDLQHDTLKEAIGLLQDARCEMRALVKQMDASND